MTFFFGIFLIGWGPQATTIRDPKFDQRIDRAERIDQVREECHTLNARLRFGQAASNTFSGVAFLYLCFVFAVGAYNVKMVRRIDLEADAAQGTIQD